MKEVVMGDGRFIRRYKNFLHPSKTDYGLVKLTYSSHALKRAKERGIVPPQVLDTSLAKVMAIELESGKLDNITYRVKYSRNSSFYLNLVVCPTIFEVKTIWLNLTERAERVRG